MEIKQEWIDKYGTHLNEYISKDAWEAATWNGGIYTVPAIWTPLAARGQFGIRKDLFDKYGVPYPKTADDLLPLGKELQPKVKADLGENYYFLISLDMPYVQSYFFDKDPSYPFFVGPSSMGGTQLFKYNNDGTTESYIESAVFKAGCDWAAELYDAGLIIPDALTIPRDTYMTQYIGGGKGLFTAGAGYWEHVADVVPGAELGVIDFQEGQEVTAYVSSFFYNSNGISATSKHPEEALQFLDWIHVQENGQLLCYGIEGEDWTASSKGQPYYIPAVTEGGYFFDMWEFLPYQFRLFTESTPEVFAKPTEVDHIVKAINAGFVFDNTPVQNEWTALEAAFSQYIWPIELGIQKYDAAMPAALAALKGMGLDKVLTEHDRQYQEWRAGQ
jgi:putative aldouronate transport system substrate-binding protein